MKASKSPAGLAACVQNQLIAALMAVRFETRSGKSATLAAVIERPVAPTIGLVMSLVVATLALLVSEAPQTLVLGLIAVLAACGLFFILALALGRLQLAPGTDGEPHDAIMSAWPEAVLITTRLGDTVFTNEAYRALHPDSGAGLSGLETWFTGTRASSESFFRLARASERGQSQSEVIDVVRRIAGREDKQVLRLDVSPFQMASPDLGPLVLWRIVDVTAQKEVSKAREGQLARELETYDRAPVGIFSVGPGGHIEHMNSTLARWLGTHDDGSHPTTRSASASADDMTLDIFSPPGAALLSQRLARPSAEGFDWTLDLNTRSGRPVPVRVVGGGDAQSARVLAVVPSRAGDSPLRGDVADPSFARHFRSAPFGIATVTAAGRIASANSAFAHMVQDGSGGVEEPALAVLCRDATAEARTAVSEALAQALAGRGGTAPVDFTTGAKGDVGRRVYMTPLATADGGGDALVLYVIDTTEQRALEAKFAQSQKMEAVGQLVGGIAHNFNNVLTAILGSADLMLQTHRASDAAHKDIQNIKQSANRAAELVSNLMAFSRQQTLRLEVLHLGDAMTDLRPMLKTSLGEKIELRISSGRDLGLVKADRSQIGQVLLNFAMNAQHAMPNGGSFTVNTRNVTEREVQKAQYPGLPTGEYVLIEVADTGTGIPRDVVGKIFEPYFTTKEVGKGTGLGLATVYGFIKQSSGFVYVDSEVGTGTTFRVYLPRLHADDADLAAPVGKKTPAPIDLTGSAKVLIVEDEDMVRSVAVRSLKRLGYTVLEAANGYEALDIVAAENGAIDIVVSDVVMPEMDGPAFLKEVRKTNPDLRIIFVSGHTNEAFKTGMDESEVFAFLPKPFSLPQLAAKVKEELSR